MLTELLVRTQKNHLHPHRIKARKAAAIYKRRKPQDRQGIYHQIQINRQPREKKIGEEENKTLVHWRIGFRSARPLLKFQECFGKIKFFSRRTHTEFSL